MPPPTERMESYRTAMTHYEDAEASGSQQSLEQGGVDGNTALASTMTAGVGSDGIPSYPNARIAQPRASLALERPAGTTEGLEGAATSTTATATTQSRASLSYADRSRRDGSGNASNPPTNQATTAPVRPLRSHRRSESNVRDINQTPASTDDRPPSGPKQEPRRTTSTPPPTNLSRLPFAAPLPESGVVTTHPCTLRDWLPSIPARPITILYLVIGQSFVAALISGAINFGVAVALYRSQPTINIWTFDRQTVAGDMGVTVIIQQVVSFIITSSLVHNDMRAPKGLVGPMRRPWPPLLHLPSTPDPQGHFLGTRRKENVCENKPSYMGRAEGLSRSKQYWWWLVRASLTGTERNDLLAPGITLQQRLQRLLWTAAQGFALCCLTFWWYWPLAIAIVAPLYEHRELAGTWIPMIIKLLYGGVMSLLTNPAMALMAMGAESAVRRGYPELDLWRQSDGDVEFGAGKARKSIAEKGESGRAASEATTAIVTR